MKNPLAYVSLVLAIVAVVVASLIALRPAPVAPTAFGSSYSASFSESSASSTTFNAIGSTTTIVLNRNAKVSYWRLCNLSATTTLYLGFGRFTNASSSDMYLTPMGSNQGTCFSMAFPNIYVGDVYILPSPSSSSPVGVSYGLAL